MDGAFPTHYIAYESRFHSYVAELQTMGLTGVLQLNVETKVWQMVETIQHIMANSPQQYVFRPREDYDSNLPHDTLGLGLLRILDRGQPRSWGYARLGANCIGGSRTIFDLVVDGNNFSLSKLALQDQHFVIHLCKYHRNLSSCPEHISHDAQTSWRSLSSRLVSRRLPQLTHV